MSPPDRIDQAGAAYLRGARSRISAREQLDLEPDAALIAELATARARIRDLEADVAARLADTDRATRLVAEQGARIAAQRTALRELVHAVLGCDVEDRGCDHGATDVATAIKRVGEIERDAGNWHEHDGAVLCSACGNDRVGHVTETGFEDCEAGTWVSPEAREQIIAATAECDGLRSDLESWTGRFGGVTSFEARQILDDARAARASAEADRDDWKRTAEDYEARMNAAMAERDALGVERDAALASVRTFVFAALGCDRHGHDCDHSDGDLVPALERIEELEIESGNWIDHDAGLECSACGMARFEHGLAPCTDADWITPEHRAERDALRERLRIVSEELAGTGAALIHVRRSAELAEVFARGPYARRDADLRAVRAELVSHEAAELLAAIVTEDRDGIIDEAGDVVFTALGAVRACGLDPMTVLARANAKAERRFAAMGVEGTVAEMIAALDAMTDVEIDNRWRAAKAEERERGLGAGAA